MQIFESPSFSVFGGKIPVFMRPRHRVAAGIPRRVLIGTGFEMAS
jgi:hypothetical protein